ncbi:AraC family transcriptional regulator [Paenibacillus glufosinatiresistens]|uniref:AraC family transcriptional regulator n=1 Tax=Paenibacillus glufosinatiresistens TaxID=3070657 RepID=UPI00286D732C|nr:GyrI-like domain-containing protein [Paenibacillus sp. YX.27]
MNLTLVTYSPCRIAYMRRTGAYGPAAREWMEKLKRWAEERNLLDERAVILGIAQDDPASTPPAECRYDVCLLVGAEQELDGSVTEGFWPGGTYAVCRIGHTAEEVARAWSEIAGAVAAGGWRPAAGPIVERYEGGLLQNGLCELCVPIEA